MLIFFTTTASYVYVPLPFGKRDLSVIGFKETTQNLKGTRYTFRFTQF